MFGGCLTFERCIASTGLDLDPICVRCGECEETLEHVFRDCAWTAFFWESSPLRITIAPPDRETCFAAWISQIRGVDSTEFHRLFCTFLWTIWYARNLLIFQQKELSHAACFDLAMKHLPTDSSPRRPSRTKARTLGTVYGFWRVRCDAAFKSDRGVGLGVYITDDREICLGCCYKFISSSVNAEVGECLAIREGVLLARRLQGKSIILETDCQTAFFRLSNSAEDLSIAGGLARDTMSLFSEFENVKVSWSRRIANTVADQLAKFALAHLSSGIFIGNLPDFVMLSPTGVS